MVALLKFLYLLGLAVWVGMLVFFTFFAAPAVFKAFPRETAGDIVGVLFPRYWALGYAAGALTLAALLALSFAVKEFPKALIALVALMTALTFYSGLVVGSKAREMKAVIKAESDASRKEAVRKEFAKVHGLSAALNFTVIAMGVAAVFLTAQRLRP